MIFESLNNNVMLIELTGDEMKRLQITYDKLENNNKAAQSAIKALIYSIDPERRPSHNERVVVEVMPVEDGGCFFILTFLPRKGGRYRVKSRSSASVLEMEGLDDFLELVSFVKSRNKMKIRGRVYKMDGKYYLSLSECDKELTDRLCEYGSYASRQLCDRIPEIAESMGEIYLR